MVQSQANAKTSKSVLIVDDHPMIRHGLADQLEKMKVFAEILEAGSLKEAKRKILDNEVDLVVLDISMTDGTGFDAIPMVKMQRPNAKIVMFTQHADLPYFNKAMELGVDGFLLKSFPREKVTEVILQVIQGGKYFTPPSDRESLPVDLFHELSKQERKVLTEITQGRSLTEVAKDMNLNVKTISTYKTRIFQKFGVKNNAQLLKLVWKNSTQGND